MGIAGRSYPRTYRVQGRADMAQYLVNAVEASGGRVMYTSEPNLAPVYVGVELGDDERVGILCYLFRCNPPPIANRPVDEHRVQVRLGGEASWRDSEHAVATDVTGVDITLLVGVHAHEGLFVGLDPLTYDPLPMGISVEFKQAEVDAIQQNGWHVWERVNRRGRRRSVPRAPERSETLIGFAPDRLLDYARLSRQAAALQLDPPLRYRAAVAAAPKAAIRAGARHLLEETFDLDHEALMNIIANRGRLLVAVRGGVAEHHLGRLLERDPDVAEVEHIDRDGPPDFEVRLRDGRSVSVECKNASPKPYMRADSPDDEPGDPRVEVQKTRAQKGDPAGRLYRPDQFQVLAACLFATTGQWEFRYRQAAALAKDRDYPDRIAPMQRINRLWADRLADAIER